jgi:DNA helicase-2/ATP-dependent DNA helicase PcrA
MADGVMKLTDEQRAAADYPASALLEACPGSGKTRTIVAKLLRCIDEVRGGARKVACITYTTAAVYEIQRRLRKLGAADDDGY